MLWPLLDLPMSSTCRKSARRCGAKHVSTELWTLEPWSPATLDLGTLEPLNLGTLDAGNLERWTYCAFLSRDSCYALTAKPSHNAEKF